MNNFFNLISVRYFLSSTLEMINIFKETTSKHLNFIFQINDSRNEN